MYEPEYNSTGPQSNLPQPQQLNGAQAESGGVNLLIRLNFKYILKLLLLWFLPITILSLVAGLSSFFVITKYKEKVYTSNAILVRYQKMVGNESKIPYLYQETDINMLLETVKLRRNMLEVIDRLDLDVAPEALFQMITVQPGNRSDTVHISVVYSDPQICADIANTLGEVFA